MFQIILNNPFEFDDSDIEKSFRILCEKDIEGVEEALGMVEGKRNLQIKLAKLFLKLS